MTNDFSETPGISLINTAATFSRHWRPTTKKSLRTVYATDIMRERTPVNDCPHLRSPYNRELCAYESPLAEGMYRVWVFVSGYSAFSSKHRAVVCSYILSLPTRTKDRPMWRQGKTVLTDYMGICPGIPYSGHKLRYAPAGQHFLHAISAPRDPTQVVGLDLPGSGPYPHISTYGGALTYLANNSVAVAYFK